MAGAGFNNAFYRAGVNRVGDLPGGPRGKCGRGLPERGDALGRRGLLFQRDNCIASAGTRKFQCQVK